MLNKQSALYLIPKATYYNDKKSVVKEGNNLHRQIFGEDRTLYSYLLYFTNSTYHSKSLIIQNLLRHSLHKPEYENLMNSDPKLLDIEDALIQHALFNESITHALKMLLSLKKERINNNRTSRVILRFLFKRGNTDFISIKYKQKIKDLLIHALGLNTVNQILSQSENGLSLFKKHIGVYNNPYAMDVFLFVFNKLKSSNNVFLQEYLSVQKEFELNNVRINKQTKIPIEVLMGFNSHYKRHYNIASLLTTAVVSDKQKIQLQRTVKQQTNNNVEFKIDFNKYSIIDLFKYMYSQSDISIEDINHIRSIITNKAEVIRKEMNLTTNDKTAIIFDCSDSNLGSQESPLHPLYRSRMLQTVLSENGVVTSFFVGGVLNEKGLSVPSGDTNLAAGLIYAVEQGYTDIILISDGFENVGSFDEVYQNLIRIGYDMKCTHFNPVFSPKNFSFKTVSDHITTIPFQNETDLPFLQLFHILNTDEVQFKQIIRDRIERELL